MSSVSSLHGITDNITSMCLCAFVRVCVCVCVYSLTIFNTFFFRPQIHFQSILNGTPDSISFYYIWSPGTLTISFHFISSLVIIKLHNECK